MALTSPRLPRVFFSRDPVIVARDLLGRILFSRSPEGVLAGRIVETEAYTGEADPASHAFRGRTARNAVMFGTPGHAYVYFSYGVHYCLNVTADAPGVAGAVLLRALEPLAGMEIMRRHGDHGPEVRLLSGPGKIGRGFGLDLKDNGREFTRGPLGLAAGTPVPDREVAVSRRIGISRAVDLPYRFCVIGSRSVSGRAPTLPSPRGGGK
ncbi:MAG TPA: DNA-3-methyladenine glycosylase [Candidatus Dormibacteraeota bacterium]|nr:DNA-3-methyladenine glycosylase [Candidatus Dormibacteraeota bacterium]